MLTFRNLRKLDASRFEFSKEALIHLRDAFLARRQEDGTQTRPEDLLDLLDAGQP